MHYSGAVYRPPSEARSLIVQCTLGCSHNKCAFCTMYKDKKFSINPIEQVLSDLDEARAYGRYIEKIFLADGDALILPMDYLLTVLDYICDHFPTCKRVAAYATTKAIMRKTDDELRTLREHGLGIVYIGLESGNEELLKKFCKGVTAEEIVLNAIRCKQAGIATSVTAINGMAGANGDWQAHAIDTAKAVSRMKPDYIAFLTLRVYSGTPLHDWIASGEFKMMEPPELMRETRLFLEHIDSDGSIFRSNHASNYLPLGGTLNRDREALIHTIDEALDVMTYDELVEAREQLVVGKEVSEYESLIDGVNPNFDPNVDNAYARNCGGCAFATWERLSGIDPQAQADWRNIGTIGGMEEACDMRFADCAPNQLEQFARSQGPGWHGMCAMEWPPDGETGHWVNLATSETGHVYVLDSQCGEVSLLRDYVQENPAIRYHVNVR